MFFTICAILYYHVRMGLDCHHAESVSHAVLALIISFVSSLVVFFAFLVFEGVEERLMNGNSELEAVEQEQSQKPQQPSAPIIEPVALNDVIDLPLSCLFERKQFYPFMYRIATVETEFVRYNYLYYPAMDWVALFATMVFFFLCFALSVGVGGLSPHHVFCNAAAAALLAGALLCDAITTHVFKKVNRNPACVHELVFWFGLFSSCAMMGILRPTTEQFCQREDMSIVRTTAIERRDACVHSIYAYPLAVVAVATVCGRPRVHLVIFSALAYLVGSGIVRAFIGIDTVEEATLKFVADTVILTAMVVCKAVLERAHRLSFEEFVKAYRSRQHAARQKEATDAYLSQLLPPMLYSRVLSREHYEDSGTSVSVFVAAVPELAEWVYPAATSRGAVCEAVGRISQLMRSFEEQHKLVGVERIRVAGDEFVATSNLIVPHLEPRHSHCRFRSQDTPLRHGVGSACKVRHPHRRRSRLRRWVALPPLRRWRRWHQRRSAAASPVPSWRCCGVRGHAATAPRPRDSRSMQHRRASAAGRDGVLLARGSLRAASEFQLVGIGCP